jgi:hypothetical protein
MRPPRLGSSGQPTGLSSLLNMGDGNGGSAYAAAAQTALAAAQAAGFRGSEAAAYGSGGSSSAPGAVHPAAWALLSSLMLSCSCADRHALLPLSPLPCPSRV